MTPTHTSSPVSAYKSDLHHFFVSTTDDTDEGKQDVMTIKLIFIETQMIQNKTNKLTQKVSE